MVTTARARGCAVWSALDAMGGPGSFAAWQREPSPRASGDGVHLTTRGYRWLGERLARDLIESADLAAQAVFCRRGNPCTVTAAWT